MQVKNIVVDNIQLWDFVAARSKNFPRVFGQVISIRKDDDGRPVFMVHSMYQHGVVAIRENEVIFHETEGEFETSEKDYSGLFEA